MEHSGTVSFIPTLTTSAFDFKRHAVDQSEVDDIDRDFPIVASAQGFVDFRFGEHDRNTRKETLSRGHPNDNPPKSKNGM